MPFIGMKRNTTRPLDFKSCEPFFESRLIKFGFNRVDGCFDYLREPIDSTPTTTYEVLTSFELKAYLDSARTLRRKGLHSRLTYLAAPLHKIATTSMLVHTHPSSTTAARSTCEGLGLGSVIRYHNGEFNLVHPGLAEVTAKSFQYSHGDATCVGFGLGWGLGWLGYHRRVHLERRNWNAEIIFKVPDVGLPLQRL
ncbi:hypothetical protein C8R47DRAFT_1215073 [Mycena vitilis]|nr:hypothetical protein C8R47DRAFT_1215073 [Mycena vitilis]